MKKLTTIALLVIVFTVGASANADGVFNQSWATPPDSNSLAMVNRQEGVYLFMLGKPVTDYDYLGTVNVSLVWKNDPESMLAVMVRKCKKKYPTADGLIFSNGMEHVDCIRFRK